MIPTKENELRHQIEYFDKKKKIGNRYSLGKKLVMYINYLFALFKKDNFMSSSELKKFLECKIFSDCSIII
jgi:hypothetical protein